MSNKLYVKTQQRLIPILMIPQRQILSIKIDELWTQTSKDHK